MSRSLKASLLLLLAAFLWGLAFVAQDVASTLMEPFSFNGTRMLLAAIAVLPTVLVMDRRAAKGNGDGLAWKKMNKAEKKLLFIAGCCCGTMMTLGTIFQQIALTLGSGAGKAGFISALYTVLVPVISLILFRKRVAPLTWLAVMISVVGLYFLCVKESFTIERSDIVLLASALSFAGHILCIDYFSHRTDCVKMCAAQFSFTSLVCLCMGFCTEHPTWQQVELCIGPILYAGVVSGAIGYTLQVLGQKDADPTVASLIMSLESVFVTLGGWFILHDVLTPRELIGCALMMAAIVLAQLPPLKKKSV